MSLLDGITVRAMRRHELTVLAPDSEEHPCIPYQVVDLCEALRSATVGRRSCTSTILETRSELQQRNHKFHSILNDLLEVRSTESGSIMVNRLYGRNADHEQLARKHITRVRPFRRLGLQCLLTRYHSRY